MCCLFFQTHLFKQGMIHYLIYHQTELRKEERLSVHICVSWYQLIKTHFSNMTYFINLTKKISFSLTVSIFLEFEKKNQIQKRNSRENKKWLEKVVIRCRKNGQLRIVRRETKIRRAFTGGFVFACAYVKKMQTALLRGLSLHRR